MYYFKSNIKAEPLIWRWYAWPYLISPATAACNIVERHLKIMHSYVQNPKIHAQAVKDPKMLGGPFIDLQGEKVEEVKTLIEETKKNCKTLIELCGDIKHLDKIILNECKGGTVETFYDRIPEMLKGIVELVYDLNNHPSIRFIEPFLYKAYYTDIYQEIALAEVKTDFRKFVFSTPRLNQSDEVYLQIPFSDKRLDTLFKHKYEPCELNEIIRLFNISDSHCKLFESFFTNVPPKQNHENNYSGNGIRIRYFGHACVLFETDSTSILFDPVISYEVKDGISRYTFADLPDYIDYIVITHNHLDHIMFETLLQLRHKTHNIVIPNSQNGALADPSMKLILKNIGFTSLLGLHELENIIFKDGEIIALPFFGEHCDLNIQSKLSYYLRIRDKNFILGADSNNLSSALYDHIFDITGSIDMLFLGMECDGAPLTWSYGPLLTNQINRTFDNSRTLSGSDFKKAWSITQKLKCKYAYVYAMGQEPWLNHVMALNYSLDSIQIIESNKFVSACHAHGIESERLFGKKEWILSSLS
ncbi:MAG: MBL fold metallo-hydrolase [Rickettsiales bacterium]|nr:MBL fold metallo-hydrolase [Rickettsiales bacterium]